MTEGAPDFLVSGIGFHLAEKCAGTRAHHPTRVEGIIHLNEISRTGRLALTEVLEPFGFRRAMIDDEIRHGFELGIELLKISPISKGRVDLFVIYNGKTVVGTVGKKGQDVQGADGLPQMLAGKTREGLEGRLAFLQDGVPVSDANGVGLGPFIFAAGKNGVLAPKTGAAEAFFGEAGAL